MVDKRLTIRISAEELTDALVTQVKERVQATIDYEVRRNVPDYVIEALQVYLSRHTCADGLNQADCNECTFCKTRAWVEGDEVDGG